MHSRGGWPTRTTDTPSAAVPAGSPYRSTPRAHCLTSSLLCTLQSGQVQRHGRRGCQRADLHPEAWRGYCRASCRHGALCPVVHPGGGTADGLWACRSVVTVLKQGADADWESGEGILCTVPDVAPAIICSRARHERQHFTGQATSIHNMTQFLTAQGATNTQKRTQSDARSLRKLHGPLGPGGGREGTQRCHGPPSTPHGCAPHGTPPLATAPTTPHPLHIVSQLAASYKNTQRHSSSLQPLVHVCVPPPACAHRKIDDAGVDGGA